MWSQIFGVGALDGAAFTKLVAKLGIESGRFVDPLVDPDAMKIRDANEWMNLSNLHREFLQLGRRERLAFVRDRVLRPITPELLVGQWEDTVPLLLPVVRDGGYLTLTALTALTADSPNPEIAHRLVAPGLFATVVIDRPEHMVLVTEQTLVAWDVSLETALETAYANLRTISQEPFIQLATGLWKAPWTDSYTSARVLLPEILQRVCTNPLVAVPARGELLVADPTVMSARVSLMSLVAMHETDSYPITRQIFHLEEKTLRVWTPQTSNAVLLADYMKCLADEKLEVYSECEMREKLDSEIHAAQLSAIEVDDRVITQTMWLGDGIHELPPADIVLFVDMNTAQMPPPMWGVPWDTVVAAGLVQPTASPLPRFVTGPFPSADWLDEHQLQPGELPSLER